MVDTIINAELYSVPLQTSSANTNVLTPLLFKIAFNSTNSNAKDDKPLYILSVFDNSCF